MKTKSIFILSIMVFILSSCFIDNCHKFGPNFYSVNIDKVEKDSSNELVIELATNTMEELPEYYFYQSRVWSNNNFKGSKDAAKTIETLTVTKDLIRFVVKSEFVPKIDETFRFTPLLNFPDRKGVLKCRHPGNGDDYLLFLEMDIFTNDGTEYQIDNFAWRESVSKGAL